MDLEKKLIVVGVFGHVDHGKTTLLDTLSKTSNVLKEFGGITQSIRPQEVTFENVKILFLDTPGHEAFTNMRKIISQVVNFGFILISKKDGVMPQTQECLNFLIKNNIKFKVLISKADTVVTLKGFILKQFNNVNLDVRRSLQISHKQLNLNKLLKLVLYNSKNYLNRTNFFNNEFKAYILDISLIKGVGVQTLLMVKRGFFKVGSFLKTNTAFCKVKSILSFEGKVTDNKTCVLNVSGWDSKPSVGELVWVVSKQASSTTVKQKCSVSERRVFDLNSLFLVQKEKLRFILKADNDGSLKALSYSVKECFFNLKNIECSVLYKKVGPISDNDLSKSHLFNSPIVYFSNLTTIQNITVNKAKGVVIFKSNIIYKILDELNSYILKKDYSNSETSEACTFIVKKVFSKDKRGVYVLGCQLLTGELWDKKGLSLYKENCLIYSDISILNLKIYKNRVGRVSGINQEFGLKVSSTVEIPEGGLLKQF